MVKSKGSATVIEVITVRPKTRQWKAWMITRSKDYPTQYFSGRLNRLDGNIAVFKHRSEMQQWTPAYAVGTWLLFDGNGYSMNMTNSEFNSQYDIIA